MIISQQLLGTREIAVFHHTGCGMLTFNSSDLQDKLKTAYPHAAGEVEKIDFLAFPRLEESVKEDVEFREGGARSAEHDEGVRAYAPVESQRRHMDKCGIEDTSPGELGGRSAQARR